MPGSDPFTRWGHTPAHVLHTSPGCAQRGTGLTRSFRHAIAKWLPSDATGREREWSRDRLVALLKERLSGVRVVVVANREPYIHNRVGAEVKWIRPASGLVTALDPIMRATGGVWVAHGSGSGDARHIRRARTACRPAAQTLRTRFAGSGSARKKSGVTTTASPTVRSGRSATSLTRGRCSTPPTGNSTCVSTRSLPRRCSRKSKAHRPSCWCRIITLPCCRGSSRRAARMWSSAISGISRGPIARPFASAPGRRRFSMGCWGAISSAFTCSFTATIFSRRSIGSSNRASTTSGFP